MSGGLRRCSYDHVVVESNAKPLSRHQLASDSRPLKIAVISDWFSERMGYAENFLPKALASLGHDVHLITSDAQPYFNSPTYRETYESFLGPPVVETGQLDGDGFAISRLRHGLFRNRIYIRGLTRSLARMRPDVVQTFDIESLTTSQAALAQPLLGYRLFLETHAHASAFSQLDPATTTRQKLSRFVFSTLRKHVARAAERCYAISPDSLRIAVDYQNFPRAKLEICSLGVDTDLFEPREGNQPAQQWRSEIRNQFGFAKTDLVCIYTGRLSEDKSPRLLAEAVDILSKRSLPFRALFVGAGTDSEVRAINAFETSVVHHFVPTQDLPRFYYGADLAVWPKQESTSQLDAAACGLPIVVSDQVEVVERVQGNGLTYRAGDATDLAHVIEQLADHDVRLRLGREGSRKMRETFSWRLVGEQRIKDYVAAVRRGSK